MNRNPLGQEGTCDSLRPHHFLSGTMPLLPCQVAPASPITPQSLPVLLISPVPPPILLSLRARHSQAPISVPYIAQQSGPSEAASSNAFLNSPMPSMANPPNTQMPPIATAFCIDLTNPSSPDAVLPCCPTCRLPFDTGRKRRLLDACGHERCYSCVFLQENCPICHDSTVQNSLHSPLHGSLQGSMHGSLQALPRPGSAIDPSFQYGAPVSSTPTPVVRRPRPAPSPMPGRPGSWVQRYHRRPVTVSIDDTLSGIYLLLLF